MMHTAINTRHLGRSNIEVTPLGLGLAALGRPGYINLGHETDLHGNYDVTAMEANAHSVLDAAWQSGVRYFDAARSYGKAEEFLSSWLSKRQIAADTVTVSSKWGYTYTADWRVHVPEGTLHEVKDHTLPTLQRQIKESNALLGRHLDLYQIHSATLESGVLSNTDVLHALAELRNNGLSIGLSVSGAKQADIIRKALEVEFDGELLFSAVQATWNLLEQSTGKALQEAHDLGLGVIVKEGLANGRLTSRNNAPEFQAKYALLQKQAEKHAVTVDAVALAAVINQPFVDTALSGAACVEHLHSNLEAVGLQWNNSLAQLLDNLVESVAEYWQTRSALSWN